MGAGAGSQDTNPGLCEGQESRVLEAPFCPRGCSRRRALGLAGTFPAPPVGCQLPSGPGRGMAQPSAGPSTDEWEQLRGGGRGRRRGGVQGVGAPWAATCTSFLLSRAWQERVREGQFHILSCQFSF